MIGRRLCAEGSVNISVPLADRRGKNVLLLPCSLLTSIGVLLRLLSKGGAQGSHEEKIQLAFSRAG